MGTNSPMNPPSNSFTGQPRGASVKLIPVTETPSREKFTNSVAGSEALTARFHRVPITPFTGSNL